MSQETWHRSMQLPRGRFVTGRLRDFDVMRGSVLNILRSDSGHALCMVHGDSHIGNTYRLGGGEWGLLDWQSSFYGVWAHDVTYLLITALTIEDRRQNERELLSYYLSRMQEHGIAIGWDAAWRDYRRHTFYACSWSMCLPEWQAEETCCLVTERAIAAAIDLDSLNA
jgi:aminoglycoside phosphotransferase (APT) family kinase protein